MNITFRQGSEQLSEKLIDRAHVRLTKLSRLIQERDEEAFVYVDVEKESGARNSDRMWSASVNLDHSGERLNAVGTGKNPDRAVEMAIKDLGRELKKAKGRHSSMTRRGYEMLKRLRQGVA